MADYMTPEEMTAAYSAAKKQEADDLLQFGRVTNSTKNALKDAETGIRDYTLNLKSSLNSLKGSLWKTVGSMTDGAKGASQYNDAISEGADYLSNYLSGKGPFGKAAAAIIKAGSMYVTAVNKQADALFKGYQDISRAGATGAGGVTELYANMQKFGYGIAELGELSALLKENSQSLAAMSGTVLEGAQTFGNVSRGIREGETGDRLLNLGVSVDNMNKGIAGYLRIQTLTGQAQKQTQDELQRGAEEYILQQERLTKLTGLNADEQNKILEQAKSEQEFGAYSLEMQQKIDAAIARGDEDAAKKLRAELAKNEQINFELVSKGATEAAHGFRRLVTGYYNDPATLKLIQTVPNFAKSVRENADIATSMNLMASDSERNLRGALELRKMGAADNVYLRQVEVQAMTGFRDYQERLEKTDDQTKPQDEATKNLVELGKAQRKTRDDLQNLLEVGIRPVTALMGGLAKVISTTTGVASGAAVGVTRGAGGTGATKTPGANEQPVGSGGGTGATKTPGANEQPVGSGGGTGKPELSAIGVQGRTAQVSKQYAPAFQQLLTALDQTGYKVYSLGGYADRDVNGQPGKKSLHALGAAIDINPGTNPLGSQLVTDMPANISQMAAGLGLGWGGNWASKKDAMHFSAAASEGGTLLPSAATGGILGGPQSGYTAMLHGTEAVVPLPDGKSIPVEMPNIVNALSEEAGLIAQQLIKMDDIMRVMQNQISVSNKILQRSQ